MNIRDAPTYCNIYISAWTHGWVNYRDAGDSKLTLHCPVLPTLYAEFTAPSQRTLLVTRKALPCHDIIMHDDDIKWNHFPRYWSFERWIYRPLVNSPHKGQWRGALTFFLSVSEQTNCWVTRQIWGIWKLRPAYSPKTPNLGQNRWYFVPCNHEIWWMTLENNRASLFCYFKLCATFHSHRWIQTGVTVRKRPIWVKFDDLNSTIFLAVWPRNLTDDIEKQ